MLNIKTIYLSSFLSTWWPVDETDGDSKQDIDKLS